MTTYNEKFNTFIISSNSKHLGSLLLSRIHKTKAYNYADRLAKQNKIKTGQWLYLEIIMRFQNSQNLNPFVASRYGLLGPSDHIPTWVIRKKYSTLLYRTNAAIHTITSTIHYSQLLIVSNTRGHYYQK